MPRMSFISLVTPRYPFLFVRASIPRLSQNLMMDSCIVELNIKSAFPPQYIVTFRIRCLSTSLRKNVSSFCSAIMFW